MDHTESADSINDSALELPAPLGLTSTSNRDRASSLRYRRPSIRIQRLPSNVAAPSQDDTTQNLKSTPPTDAGNTLRGGRGRSSSEPQPGRWSAPTTKVVSQDATGSSAMPMPCVYEETSSPTQVPSSESPQIPGLPAAPPPTTKPPGRRNMLRRTSEVVLSAVGRNRAATISGSSPLAAQQTNEYDPRLVDVLDVVGMNFLPPWVRSPLYNALETNPHRPGGISSHHAYECPELAFRSQFGAHNQSQADFHSHAGILVRS